MKYYALSDIHGYYDLLIDTMKNINLENINNVVVFCGDYIDGHAECNSMKVLYYLFDLQKKYKGRVVVLRGNHEQWFLEYIEKGVGQFGYPSIETLQDFMSKEEFFNIITYAKSKATTQPDVLFYVLQECRKSIIKNHKDLIDWMKEFPFYYETDRQIFVHAGIEEIESHNEYWKECTDEQTYLMKHSFSADDFYKDIIAGHASSASVANNNNYIGKIYRNGNSHFYIDGTVDISKRIPILVYDTDTKEYSEL